MTPLHDPYASTCTRVNHASCSGFFVQLRRRANRVKTGLRVVVQMMKEGEGECVMCLGGVADGELIWPCRCADPVHRDCLNKWRAESLDAQAMTHCTICHHLFEFEADVADSESKRRAEFRRLVCRDLSYGVVGVLTLVLT